MEFEEDEMQRQLKEHKYSKEQRKSYRDAQSDQAMTQLPGLLAQMLK